MKTRQEYIANATENIARYYAKEASLCERAGHNFGELSAYASGALTKELRARGFLADGALEANLPPFPVLSEALDGVPPENLPLVASKLRATEAAYLAELCRRTTASLAASAKRGVSPMLFAPPADRAGEGRVSFAGSNLLSTAFSTFRCADSRLTARFVHSFADACEDVASGESEYCILPIENSREGVLPTVYSLLSRHELFIIRVCSVESLEITTKFALLCRGRRDIMNFSDAKYITLRLSGQDASAWSRLHIGAEVLGVETVSMVSLPLGYTDGYAHICTLSGSREALFALLLYLGIARIGYALLGAYEFLEK